MLSAATLQSQQQALALAICAADPGQAMALLRPLRDQPPRLAVYRHAWRARLTEALRSNYPVLHAVLGDDGFAELATAFLADCPSRTASIRWFGAVLPGWLATQPERLPHPAVVDLARMEWALGLSFDSADAEPLGAADLADRPAGDWPDLRLAAHPSVSLLNLDWAVEALWQALSLDATLQTEAPSARPHALLVWRAGLDSRWRILEAGEAALLGACIGGQAFAELCALAEDQQPGLGPATAATALRSWLADGLLVLPPSAPHLGPT